MSRMSCEMTRMSCEMTLSDTVVSASWLHQLHSHRRAGQQLPAVTQSAGFLAVAVEGDDAAAVRLDGGATGGGHAAPAARGAAAGPAPHGRQARPSPSSAESRCPAASVSCLRHGTSFTAVPRQQILS